MRLKQVFNRFPEKGEIIPCSGDTKNIDCLAQLAKLGDIVKICIPLGKPDEEDPVILRQQPEHVVRAQMVASLRRVRIFG
jgi:hypothetical protein